MNKKKITGWQLAYLKHSDAVKVYPHTSAELKNGAFPVIKATVPGNFELDLIKDGKLPQDIYFGTNILELQKLEDTHLWYFTEFEIKRNGKDAFLLFEGIDTVSEIFIDGNPVAITENMFIPYELPLDRFEDGIHEVVVHIIPANVYARSFPLPSKCSAQKHSYDSLTIRKAPYMYGWDIMPRTVSAGLWKPVSIVYKNPSRIEEFTYSLHRLKDGQAQINFNAFIHSDTADLSSFTLRIEGKCADSHFLSEHPVFCANHRDRVTVEFPYLWWPKNYGAPNLYSTTVTLFCNDKAVDKQTLNIGLRFVELERSSLADKNGTFRFIVNGQPVFVMGTNWVPTDAFPSRHTEFDKRALELALDIGCNMIRCWGGNVYTDIDFYDFCDKNGILVWQDFAMACAVYPDDSRMCALLRTEAQYVVKALRNHPSLAIWSGDNECDIAHDWAKTKMDGKTVNRLDPNNNRLTREVLLDVVSEFDGTRPYIPSSPYIDSTVFESAGKPSEDHLWGPRDYFKCDFYNKNSVCHFASETGYHGCPSVTSLKRFISADSLDKRGDNTVCDNVEWLTHATCPVPAVNEPYAYRIPLMTKQVERIFGTASSDLDMYSHQSQISQAEAVKFFIEHFRIQKWYRTGILWWNLIDGWPQISDAVVDYYGAKKLAYHHIKRSQSPFCIMCDEPDENGIINLCASNDTRTPVKITFTVTDVLTNEVKTKGDAEVQPDTTAVISAFKENKGEYLLIEWSGDVTGKNHFVTSIGDGITLENYKKLEDVL